MFADILRLFHYWDKCSGKTHLVDTTRERLEAVLLKDYLLYPGAEWSRLPQGTAVLVLGKAPVGNTYCVKTTRSVVCTEVGVVRGKVGVGAWSELGVVCRIPCPGTVLHTSLLSLEYRRCCNGGTCVEGQELDVNWGG